MRWHEVVERLAAEGLPPVGWKRLVIKRANGDYEISSLITDGSYVHLDEGEEVVAEVRGSLRTEVPYFPEHYGDSDFVLEYLLRAHPEKVRDWSEAYGPFNDYNPIGALKEVGVDPEDFFSSPEGEKFLGSAEEVLVKDVLLDALEEVKDEVVHSGGLQGYRQGR
ncbi:MAG: hypothetical protein N2557_08000 [Hydrogenophilus sp.]|nr:hypothetical protein [Hydrogenophilus sp.]